MIISGAGLPLGLPGRVIDNNFVAQIKQGQTLVDTLSAELAEALAANPALRPLRTSPRKSRETQQACARVIEQTLNELG